MPKTRWERQLSKRAKLQRERGKFRAAPEAGPSGAAVTVVQPDQPTGAEAAVVASVAKNKLVVMVGDLPLEAGLLPELAKRAETDFVVGDRAWISRDPAGRAVVLGRAERRSFVARMRGDRNRPGSLERQVLAANVDLGVIVVALKDPDPHPQFIDRFLVLLQDGGVQPVICLSKSDLGPEWPVVLADCRDAGVPVIVTSSLSGDGLAELKRLLLGKTAVFVGQSGVGKSTLANAIDPAIGAVTQAVSAKTGEGRHTTTGSSLYRWAPDSYLIDTPGIRSLGVETIPKDELSLLFPEFAAHAAACRFNDCRHLDEPRCAVRQALGEAGTATERRRYASYVRMMGE